MGGDTIRTIVLKIAGRLRNPAWRRFNSREQFIKLAHGCFSSTPINVFPVESIDH